MTRAESAIGSPRPSWMSRLERKRAWPPICTMPTSKLTRVRVEDFSKIMPRLLSAKAVRYFLGLALTSAARRKRPATSAAVKSWTEIRWRGAGMEPPMGEGETSYLYGGLDRVALDRHGHAARTAARPGELVGGEGDDRLAAADEIVAAGHHLLLGQDAEAAPPQLLDRLPVAAVEQDDPRGDGEGVGAVRPLLALLVDGLGGATAGHDVELQPEVRQGLEERRPDGEGQLPGVEVDVVDVRRLAPPRLDDRQMGEAGVPVDEGEDRVEVHVGALGRQLDEDQVAERRLLQAQVLGEDLDPAPVGALARPHEDDLRRGDEHVAALHAGVRVVGVVLR